MLNDILNDYDNVISGQNKRLSSQASKYNDSMKSLMISHNKSISKILGQQLYSEFSIIRNRYMTAIKLLEKDLDRLSNKFDYKKYNKDVSEKTMKIASKKGVNKMEVDDSGKLRVTKDYLDIESKVKQNLRSDVKYTKSDEYLKKSKQLELLKSKQEKELNELIGSQKRINEINKILSKSDKDLLYQELKALELKKKSLINADMPRIIDVSDDEVKKMLDSHRNAREKLLK